MSVTAALELLLALLARTQEISILIAKLNAEGRTELTDEEWAVIVAADDLARARLQALIDARKAGGTGK
ncbi:MAG TPA: hypothetical protein VLH36_11340 [Steroidobacteraceae bacterium]|jgi:hypothetical protein|nr:hypothetical protein [Steroidobacteraceae bacterium]